MLLLQVSSISLSRGLHLCYLQSHTTLDSMSVVVTNTAPSILPSSRVRDNPHVTSEEWAWIRHLNRCEMWTLHCYSNVYYFHVLFSLSSLPACSPTTNFLIGEGEEEGEQLQGRHRQLRPSESQYNFGQAVQQAVTRLFQVSTHRTTEHKASMPMTNW